MDEPATPTPSKSTPKKAATISAKTKETAKAAAKTDQTCKVTPVHACVAVPVVVVVLIFMWLMIIWLFGADTSDPHHASKLLPKFYDSDFESGFANILDAGYVYGYDHNRH
jgi:hypothetical protein